MTYTSRNAVWVNADTFDCEINHPDHGWIPFTASRNDELPEGRALHAAILAAGDFLQPTPEAEAAELAAARNAAHMPKGDFCLALYAAGKLSASDADVAAGGGWPDSFAGAVAGLPEAQQLGARIKWRGAQNVYRMDPLLLAVAAYMTASPDLPDMTSDELDALFGI